MFRNVQAVQYIAGLAGNSLDHSNSSRLKILGRSCCDDSTDHVEWQVSSHVLDGEESEEVHEHLLIRLALESSKLLDAVIETVSLSVCLSKILHDIRGLVHQYFVASFPLLGEVGLSFLKLVKKRDFSELQEV